MLIFLQICIFIPKTHIVWCLSLRTQTWINMHILWQSYDRRIVFVRVSVLLVVCHKLVYFDVVYISVFCPQKLKETPCHIRLNVIHNHNIEKFASNLEWNGPASATWETDIVWWSAIEQSNTKTALNCLLEIHKNNLLIPTIRFVSISMFSD